MQLLIINPNTSTRVTAAIKTVAERFASPDTHLKVIQATTGPETIRCRHEELLSVPATLECVRAESLGCEGILFACFGDHPAIYACREPL
ncbi:MAG: hypothetical protein HC926_00455 [Synechococcaceae cyanobacterium SM2_3_60]|nr:hypothetical protein [Synechococcaceae cyanobacterium SM2_3_60]